MNNGETRDMDIVRRPVEGPKPVDHPLHASRVKLATVGFQTWRTEIGGDDRVIHCMQDPCLKTLKLNKSIKMGFPWPTESTTLFLDLF